MSEISNISPAAASVLRSPLLNITGNTVSETNRSATPSTSPTVNSLSTTNASSSVAESNKQLTSEMVNAAVDAGNTILKASNKNLQFQIDDATKQVVISIVDSTTGKVVRQIPTVEMLDFMRAMALQETNAGKILQAKA
jgi:flagellar protein FlaG